MQLKDSRHGGIGRKKLIVYMENPAATNIVLARYLGEAAEWIWIPRLLGVSMIRVIRSCEVFAQLEEKGLTEDEIHESLKVKVTLHIKLKTADKATARMGLLSLGLHDTQRLAAFVTRDSAYLRTLFDNEELTRRHSYRDCSIDNYLQAVDHATARGWQCVHVGRKYLDSPRSLSTSLIDYPSSTVNSDLMDLVFALHSRVLFTPLTGLDTLYWSLGVPLVGVNVAYLREIHGSYLMCCMPKRMFVLVDGIRAELPMWTSLTTDFRPVQNGATWRKHPVQFVENRPAEVLEAVKLGLDLLDDPFFRIHREQESRQLYSDIQERTGMDTRRWPVISFPDSVMSRSYNLPETFA